MATLYSHQRRNVQKTWLLITTFLVLIIGLGWFFSYYFANPLILYFAVFFSLLMNLGSYWYSDKIVLALSGARAATKDEYRELWNVTENLAITSGLPMPRLYVIDDPAPNAFATGRNKEHAAVAVTTGLLSLLERSELEGVIAHELSHIGNRDILISTIVVVLVGFVTLLSDFFIRASMFGGRRARGGGGAGVIALAGIILAILSPLIAMFIQLAISRKREFLADASGSLLTRYPEGLASALRKIGSYSRPMMKANHATAHLFIANPFGSGREALSWIGKLFMTHPPIEDRIKALLGGRSESSSL